jgi:Holliday junction resolvase RusA-like endonuclease
VRLDGPPVPKGRARAGNGHHYTPPRTAAFEQRLGLELMLAMGIQRWRPGGRGPFLVELLFVRAAERGDLDNFVKSALDAANLARVWSDDARVTRLVAEMTVDASNPRTEIRIVERS